MNDTVVGWREWVSLPALGIPAIKAKVDTGAKTSCLHAFELELFQEAGVETVRFKIHPLRKDRNLVLTCRAPVLGRRTVRDSGGHSEERIVIETSIQVGDRLFSTPVTLTSREDMLFRMLLGRRLLAAAQVCVDPSASYLLGKISSRKAREMYREMTG